MLRRWIIVLVVLASFCVLTEQPKADHVFVAPQSSTWPTWDAALQVIPVKTAGKELSPTGDFSGLGTCPDPLIRPAENCDSNWGHLHEGEMDAEEFTVGIHRFGNGVTTQFDIEDDAGFECQWYIHGIATGTWVTGCGPFTIERDDPDLAALENGIHDVQFDIRWPSGVNDGAMNTTVASSSSTTVFTVNNAGTLDVGDFILIIRNGSCGDTIRSAFPRKVVAKSGNQLTVNTNTYGCGNSAATALDAGDTVRMLTKTDIRGRYFFVHSHSHGRDESTECPVMEVDGQYIAYDDIAAARGSMEYIPCERADLINSTRTYTVDDTQESWDEIPCADCGGEIADLYQELLMPHTDLFMCASFPWEEPPSSAEAGMPFVRCFGPKADEHQYHPNLYTTYFHNRMPSVDGPLGKCWMSGYAGGMVDQDGNFWFVEPSGRFGKFEPNGTCTTYAGYVVKSDKFPIWLTKPLDTVLGNMDLKGTWSSGPTGFKTPLDVAQDPQNPTHFYIADAGNNSIRKVVISGGAATITTFAGATDGSGGYTNATGTSARFSQPASVVWDLTGDYLYVADTLNDAVRRISRTGVVTTLFGQDPGEGRRGDEIIADMCAATYFGDPIPSTNRTCSQYEGANPDAMLPQTVRMFSNGDLGVLDSGFNGSIRRVTTTGTITATEVHLHNTGRWNSNEDWVWRWMDIDRWGNSGPLDGIYFGCFQCSSVNGVEGGSRTNEAYGWVSEADGAHFIFGPDLSWCPAGFGNYYCSDPPHYYWMSAVRPQGGVYLLGGGEIGITLLRPRRDGDINPSNYSDYEVGRLIWLLSGTDWGASPELKYGFAGNFIGQPSLWDVEEDTTDAEIRAMFDISDHIWNDTNYKRQILEYIRTNAGPVMTLGDPPSEEPLIKRRLPVRLAEVMCDWGFSFMCNADVNIYANASLKQRRLIKEPHTRH